MIAITLMVSIVPLILLGAAIYYQFGKLYGERIEDQVRHLARSQSNAVDVFLKERTNFLSMIVETQSFEELNDQEHLTRLFQLIKKRADGLGLVDLGVIDKKGNQLGLFRPIQSKGIELLPAAVVRSGGAARHLHQRRFHGVPPGSPCHYRRAGDQRGPAVGFCARPSTRIS